MTLYFSATTVRCWKCDRELDVMVGPLWGECWDCHACTGEDGVKYEFVLVGPRWSGDKSWYRAARVA